MSLLTELILSLSDEEFTLLNAELNLKGKEQIVFDFVLRNRNNRELSKATAIKEFNLTSSHYDKINNTLLRKCYSVLGGEGIDLLHYLNQKLLVKHLLHEIKINEKNLIATEKHSHIYRIFFDLIVSVPAKYFIEQFAIKYGEKLINLHKNDENTNVYVNCRLLYSKLNIVRHGKPSKTVLNYIYKKINEIINTKNFEQLNTEVQLWLFKTLAFFYLRIDKNREKHYYYLNKTRQLFEKNPELPVKEKAVNECNIASHYYEVNNLIKAQECYRDTFNKYSHLVSNEVRHIARYIELCMLLSDFKLAEKLYKKYLNVFLRTEHDAHAVLASLTYSKYLIHCSKYNQVLPVIQRGKLLNSRMIYYVYDVELRMLENIVFALRKDYDFALDLAFKNLKFISSQGLSIKKFLHAHFFRLLINIIYLIKEQRSISKQVLKYYDEYQQGELLIYGVLIDKLKKVAAYK